MAIDTKNYPLAERYAQFNAAYFDNALDQNLKISFAPLSGLHGVFRYNRKYVMEGGVPKLDPKTRKPLVTGYVMGSGRLQIDNTKVRTEEFLDGILLHEMCHVWVTQVLSNPGAENGGHNDQFLDKVAEIQAKVPFLVPVTEADDSGITGVTELITISFIIVSQGDIKAFALIDNREADDWRREGYDATSDALKRQFGVAFSTADKVVLNKVSDPELSRWWVETGQRLHVYDTVSAIDFTKLYTTIAMRPVLSALVTGEKGKIIGEFFPTGSSLLGNSATSDAVSPASTPAVDPAVRYPFLSEAMIPREDEPLPRDGRATYVFATLNNGMPGLLETIHFDDVEAASMTLYANLRHDYPDLETRTAVIERLVTFIDLFKAMRADGNNFPCSAASLNRLLSNTGPVFNPSRVVVLAQWLDSLDKTAPAVNFNGMNELDYRDRINKAFRNRVASPEYATYIQRSLFHDDDPTSPTDLLMSLLRGSTNTNQKARWYTLYAWMSTSYISEDLADSINKSRVLDYDTIFKTRGLWISYNESKQTKTYDVSPDGERPQYPHLLKAEVPKMDDEAVVISNVFGNYTSKFAFLLAGVTDKGQPTYTATNSDPSAQDEPTSSWYINIGKAAKSPEEASRGIDFAKAFSTLYQASGNTRAYSGADMRLHVQLAMQSGVFAEDRVDRMVAWLNGIRGNRASVDTSDLTLSNLANWLRSQLDEAMGSVNDIDFLQYVANRMGLATQENRVETTNQLAHRVIMMDQSFNAAKSDLTRIPLSLYLGDVFPEKFYTEAASPGWSDSSFDGLFSLTNLREDFEQQKPKTAVAPAETPAATDETNGNDKPFYVNPKGDPYDRYALIVLDQPTNSLIGAAGIQGYPSLVNTQDLAVAEKYRHLLVLDRNDPNWVGESMFVATVAHELEAIMRRFTIKLTAKQIRDYLYQAAHMPDFEMLDDTRVKSLEQWYMQWFGEPWTYDRELPYTHALLQLSGAIQRAQRDDKGFNRYVLNEMKLGDGRDSGVHNQALLAQLMQKFGSSSDSLGLWLLNLPQPLVTALIDQGKVNFEAISYVFAQTSVATLRERWEESQKPPEPTVRLYRHEDLVAQGFKATGIVYESEQVPTQGFLQKAHNQLGVGPDDIGAYRLAVDKWEVYLKPGVVSPVLQPETLVRAPKVSAPTGTRSNLQITVDRETKRLVLREEPQDEAKGKNRIGQVNKREARPIAALLNVLLAEDFDDIAAAIREGEKRQAADKLAKLATRLTPYFKKTVETKHPFGDLQPWIDENFGKGYTGAKPELHAQKQAMIAMEGVRAKLTPKQRKYLTNPQTRKEVFALLGIKLR